MGQVLSHRVKIMGREFHVKSPATPETVAEIEQFVNDRLNAVSRVVAVGDNQAAISLALLNLAGEYMTMKDNLTRQEMETSKRLNCLLDRMDGLGF